MIKEKSRLINLTVTFILSRLYSLLWRSLSWSTVYVRVYGIVRACVLRHILASSSTPPRVGRLFIHKLWSLSSPLIFNDLPRSHSLRRARYEWVRAQQVDHSFIFQRNSSSAKYILLNCWLVEPKTTTTTTIMMITKHPLREEVRARRPKRSTLCAADRVWSHYFCSNYDCADVRRRTRRRRVELIIGHCLIIRSRREESYSNIQLLVRQEKQKYKSWSSNLNFREFGLLPPPNLRLKVKVRQRIISSRVNFEFLYIF